MDVAWAMLANYAEDNHGLLYIQGGTWDTITVNSPLEGVPPEMAGVFALMRGFYVARLEFHQTETGRPHNFELIIIDADGQEVAKIGGQIQVVKTPGLPPGWHQNVSLVIPLTGLPLRHPGEYRFNLLVNGEHKQELPFRVIKGF